jgi:hypothetical protein
MDENILMTESDIHKLLNINKSKLREFIKHFIANFMWENAGAFDVVYDCKNCRSKQAFNFQQPMWEDRIVDILVEQMEAFLCNLNKILLEERMESAGKILAAKATIREEITKLYKKLDDIRLE